MSTPRSHGHTYHIFKVLVGGRAHSLNPCTEIADNRIKVLADSHIVVLPKVLRLLAHRLINGTYPSVLSSPLDSFVTILIQIRKVIPDMLVCYWDSFSFSQLGKSRR